jgi:protein-tyrosine kinase
VSSIARMSPATSRLPGGQQGWSEREPAELSQSLATLTAPLSSAAEAIRALRTHVLAQHIHQGRRALAVCGPNSDVGCTFVAANLAVALAQVGISTLLVDGDLRSPMIDQMIKPRSQQEGLRACLSSPGSRVGDYIDFDVLPNLSVLYAGVGSANAQELLARDWFGDVMNFCMRDFEATIIDTPPANSFADSRRISHVVGYSLVVARRNKSLVSDVKTLVEQLIDDRVHVVGTVLNAD